jgi:hypothetical protein
MKSSGIFLLAVSSLLPCTANAYASWLRCYQDLSTDEVVMNYRVKDFDEAIHKVTLEVKKVDDTEWSDTLTYPADASTLINVRLKVPEAIASTQVQYHIETSTGAAFTEPGAVCNGKRSFSRNFDVPVTLEIKGNEPSVSLLAGWATGHAPVSLTQQAVLLRDGVSVEEL